MIDKQIVKLPLLLVLLMMLGGCTSKTTKKNDAELTTFEIRQTDEGYRIFHNNELFYIKGAGAGQGTEAEDLVRHGVNAARTWTTHDGKVILDLAHKYGIKVMMGIWLVPERHGADYNDQEFVKEQYDRIRNIVMELKGHPALMCWGIGNELNLNASNPMVWDAVNDISKMIHELDPHQLTTSTLAGFDAELAKDLETRASDLNFLSIQLYGPIDRLGEIIDESGYEGPLLVTEWGATGYWEVDTTSWGAPIENHSSKKADLYLSRYQNAIVDQAEQVMGSFVFLWGNKHERTPTWFGMHLSDGTETEAVDVMHYAWNGKWPENRSPRLNGFTLDGKLPTDNIKLSPEMSYTAKVDVTDPDNDELSYRWEIMEESRSTKSGGDKEEIPPVIEGLFQSDTGSTATFQAPKIPGAYRLFIYVYDGHRHAAHANIPFFVE